VNTNAPDVITQETELDSFRSRLADWVRRQPDVDEFTDLGDGFYGYAVAGVPDGVSMVVRATAQH